MATQMHFEKSILFQIFKIICKWIYQENICIWFQIIWDFDLVKSYCMTNP